MALARVSTAFLVLSGLVARFPVGAVFLHVLHLRFGELRVLGESLVDLLHVGRAVEGERRAGEEHRCKCRESAFHGWVSCRVVEGSE